MTLRSFLVTLTFSIFTAAPSVEAQTGALAEELAIFQAGGLEMNSAGWYLVYTTVADPDTLYRGFPQPSEYSVRDWWFWFAKPRYARAYSSIQETLGRNAKSVPVALRATMIGNNTFRYGVVHNQVAGSYEIHGNLNSHGISVLTSLVAPTEIDAGTGDITDWYGIRRPAASSQTKMRIAIVADDEVYIPLSVTRILEEVAAKGLTEYIAVVADGLTQAESADLLRKLHGFGEVGTPFCYEADANSTGFAAVATGTLRSGVASGLHLEVVRGVPGQFGYFLVGTGVSDPGIAVSEGHLCLAITATSPFGRSNGIGVALDSIGYFDDSGVLQNTTHTSTTGTGYDIPLDLPPPMESFYLEVNGIFSFGTGVTMPAPQTFPMVCRSRFS